MKFVARGEKKEKPREKTYSDSVSSFTKPTWCDRDTNSGPQLWQASVYPLAPRTVRLDLRNLIAEFLLIHFIQPREDNLVR